MEIVETIRFVIAIAFCVPASVFALGGTVGLLRAPDTYMRLQGASIGSTTAPLSLFFAALAASADRGTFGRIILIIVFFFISSPISTHIIARYSWYSGLDPWAPPKGKEHFFRRTKHSSADKQETENPGEKEE